MARVGFLGLGFLGFFNLTQTNQSPKVWVFFGSCDAGQTNPKKISKKYKIFPSLFQA